MPFGGELVAHTPDHRVETHGDGYLRRMPTGKGIYDEEHREKKGAAGDNHARAKDVPEDTPDVDTTESTSQEPPD